MNEVTKVHLGRQSFTISVAAHKELQAYLKAIEQRGGKEVAEEVELRMAELLTEQGISGDKVVIEKDIVYLKDQLGEPKDFTDDNDAGEESPDETQPKRLFRDTKNGMVAGVASGIAAYINVDPVIIRLLFVVATLAGGWGIPLYIIMWLIVPEAKTTSDTLQMRGKAVTVDSLKNAIDRADLPGAATRASNKLGPIIESIGRIFLIVVGSFIAAISSIVLFVLVAVGIYMSVHHGVLLTDNAGIIPVGGTEIAASAAALLAVGILTIFGVLIGVAMARQKWQLPAWGVAAMLGIFFLSAGTTAALTPDIASRVNNRYHAAQHQEVRKMEPFNSLKTSGEQPTIIYEQGDTYEVRMDYIGSFDTSTITTKIENGTLYLDATDFDRTQTCKTFCLFSNHNLVIRVRTPKPIQVLEGSRVVVPGFYDSLPSVDAPVSPSGN